MLTSAVALAFILKGNVQQHRQWMTRSFAVALVFLEVRVILGVTGWERLGPAAVETVVWYAMSLPFCSRTLYCNGKSFGGFGRSPCDKTGPAPGDGTHGRHARLTDET